LIVLVASRVRMVGGVEDLLASHFRLTGPRGTRLPGDAQVIVDSHTDRQSTLIVRSRTPLEDPSFHIEQLTLEALVLAYMSEATPHTRPVLEATR
jgi:ABC-2 type transport system ATP-binding protein